MREKAIRSSSLIHCRDMTNGGGVSGAGCEDRLAMQLLGALATRVPCCGLFLTPFHVVLV